MAGGCAWAIEGAIADYTNALELDSKNVKAWVARGFAEGRKGDNEGAIADYTRALELDPENALAPRIRHDLDELRAKRGAK